MPEQEPTGREVTPAPKKKGVMGCSFPVFITLLVIALVLFVTGFASGPIGRSMLGGVNLPSWISVPQPAPKLPAEVIFHLFGFPITNSIIATWITMVVLVGFSFAVTRRMTLKPGRGQMLLEFLLGTFLLGFCQTVAGKVNGRKFFPIVATIFLFVILNGWLGLLPVYGSIGVIKINSQSLTGLAESVKSMSLDHETETTLLTPIEHAQEALHEGNKQETIHSWESFIEIAREESGHGLTAEQAGELVAEAKEMEPHLLRPANTDINTPLALALISFVFVLFFGLRALGLGYLRQYFNFGQLFIGLGQLVRGRIGAGLSGILMGIINVFIGLVELLSMFTRVISFTLRLFGNMTAGEILLLMATFLIPYLFALPFYGLELLVGFIQALIFSALTLIFLTVAVTSHEEHGEESHK